MITKVVENPNARRSSETEKGTRHTRGWIVHSNAKTDDSARVLNAPKIPRRGDKHPSDGGATVKQRDAQYRQKSAAPWVWDVTVEYERSVEDDAASGSEKDNPALLPEIQFGGQTSTRHTDEDYFGNPLINSAGDPFDEGAEVSEELTTMEISATVPFNKVTTALIKKWRNTIHGPNVAVRDKALINANAFPRFFDWGGLEVKFTSIQVSLHRTAKAVLWKLRLPFLIGNWLDLFRDEGVNQADLKFQPGLSPGASGGPLNIQNRRIILDDHGMPVNRPVLLDGKGKPLKDGKAVNLPYQMIRHANLNELLTALDLPKTLDGYNILPAP